VIEDCRVFGKDFLRAYRKVSAPPNAPFGLKGVNLNMNGKGSVRSTAHYERGRVGSQYRSLLIDNALPHPTAIPECLVKSLKGPGPTRLNQSPRVE
jgi:hypothetical protein